jgi:hypothetical protein
MLTGQPGCQDTPFIRARIAALSVLTLDPKTGPAGAVGAVVLGAVVLGAVVLGAVVLGGVVAGCVGDAAAGGEDVVTVGVGDGAGLLPPAAQPAAIRAAASTAAAAAVFLVTRSSFMGSPFMRSPAREHRG